MAPYIHEGVQGDHSTDGWLEWDLAERFAKEQIEREAQGNFGAEEAIYRATGLVERATNTSHIRRAELFLAMAGLLAAREARFFGHNISGWEGEVTSTEPPAFERMPDGQAHWIMDVPLRLVEKFPDRLKVVANLADNPLFPKA